LAEEDDVEVDDLVGIEGDGCVSSLLASKRVCVQVDPTLQQQDQQ
jgi:hypothetical protein